MAKNNSAITLKGNQIEVLGNSIEEGQKLPEVTLRSKELKDVKLSEYGGKPLLVLSVPSLDTPVCEIEAKKFNERIKELGEKATTVLVSMDLPFAQSRFCKSEEIDSVICLSDYKHREFGQAFGVLAEPVGFFIRALFVADAEGTVKYLEYVNEIAEEPDYDKALEALKSIG